MAQVARLDHYSHRYILEIAYWLFVCNYTLHEQHYIYFTQNLTILTCSWSAGPLWLVSILFYDSNKQILLILFNNFGSLVYCKLLLFYIILSFIIDFIVYYYYYYYWFTFEYSYGFFVFHRILLPIFL